jgi:hypothetical protein
VGVRIDEVPVTPDKVIRALREKGKGREGRYGPRKFPEPEWGEPLRVKPPWEGGDGRPEERRGAKS